jgi:hypothetical protein
MNYITANEAMENHLRGILEPVEIRNRSGKVLGHYTPLVSPDLKAAYERAAQLFDLEEAERLVRTEKHGYTFEQVMEHLRSLEKSE